MNGGKLSRLVFAGDLAIGIDDLTVALVFENGVGKSRAVRLDTDQPHTAGIGVIDRCSELIDVLLQPEPRKTTSLAL